MLLAIVMVSRFLSMSIHTLNPSFSIRIPYRAATNYIVSTWWYQLAFANADSVAAATGKDMMMIPAIELYHLHT